MLFVTWRLQGSLRSKPHCATVAAVDRMLDRAPGEPGEMALKRFRFEVRQTERDEAGAIARELQTPGVSVAAIPLRALVAEGGVLAQLRAQGYEAISAASGASALDILRDDPTIAAMLIDVVMPGMDGTELARLTRVIRPSVQILFMTVCSSHPWNE